MINENFFLKKPLNFNGKCFIYSPTLNEIVENENFKIFRHLLTISQEEIEDEYLDKDNSIKIPTPLEYIMSISYFNKETEKLVIKGFEFFIKEPITFIYEQKKILIGDIEKLLLEVKSVEELKFIDENEYFDFQNRIRECLGEKIIEKPNPNEDPRIKRIKAKARYRDKIKAKQNLGLSFGSSLATICCMNLGITPLNVGELSYVAFKSLIDYYQEKEKYELDTKSILAGGDSKKIKPKYWVRNLE